MPDSHNKFRIYPNPACEIIFIEIPEDITLLSVFVYCLLGKNVLNASSLSNEINVSAPDDGVYFLKTSTNQGQVVQKMVIE